MSPSHRAQLNASNTQLTPSAEEKVSSTPITEEFNPNFNVYLNRQSQLHSKLQFPTPPTPGSKSIDEDRRDEHLHALASQMMQTDSLKFTEKVSVAQTITRVPPTTTDETKATSKLVV